MKRLLAIGTASLMLLGSTAAMAQPYGYRGYDHYRGGGNVAGAAVAAGILGLAIGAIAASSTPHYYAPAYSYAPPPPPVYYGAVPAYRYGYAVPAYRYAAPGYAGVNLRIRGRL